MPPPVAEAPSRPQNLELIWWYQRDTVLVVATSLIRWPDSDLKARFEYSSRLHNRSLHGEILAALEWWVGRDEGPQPYPLRPGDLEAMGGVPVVADERVPPGVAAVVGPDGLEGAIVNVDRAKRRARSELCVHRVPADEFCKRCD